MSRQHSSKSISFLMELVFVLLFFTIASAIAVFVVSSAKEKNDFAMNARNAIFYGENLIEQTSGYLAQDTFYLDEKGNPTKTQDVYQVQIKREDIWKLRQQKCTMKIQRNGKQLTTLTFLYSEEDAS